MQEQVDQFIDMARKQIETLWKQYVISQSVRLIIIFI